MKKIASCIVFHEQKIAIAMMLAYGCFVLLFGISWRWIPNPYHPILPWMPPKIPVPC